MQISGEPSSWCELAGRPTCAVSARPWPRSSSVTQVGPWSGDSRLPSCCCPIELGWFGVTGQWWVRSTGPSRTAWLMLTFVVSLSALTWCDALMRTAHRLADPLAVGLHNRPCPL
jgi:hypothetical protein